MIRLESSLCAYESSHIICHSLTKPSFWRQARLYGSGGTQAIVFSPPNKIFKKNRKKEKEAFSTVCDNKRQVGNFWICCVKLVLSIL